MKLGDKLRVLRGNMSYGEFAKLSGVSKGQLHQIENGEAIPRIDTLAKIAAAYGQSVIYLLHGTEYAECQNGKESAS